MTRGVKQLVYGTFYACIWAAIIYGVYVVSIKPAPLCTDNIKNQDETEVDCGGAHCVSCEIKNLAPIQVLPVKVLAGVNSSQSTAVVELRNTNANYGVTAYSYTLELFAADPLKPVYAERIELPLYPAEVKYRITGNIPAGMDAITKATATSDVRAFPWVPTAEFSKPKLPLREIQSQPGTDRITVVGFVKNDNAYPLRRATVNVLFENAGKLLTVSKTTVNDMLPFEERGFQVVVPFPESLRGESLPAPRIVIDGER